MRRNILLIHFFIHGGFSISDAVDFIEKLFEIVEALSSRVTQAQENMKRIVYLINQWNFCPLYERSHGNKQELLEYRILDRVNARYVLLLPSLVVWGMPSQKLNLIFSLFYLMVFNGPLSCELSKYSFCNDSEAQFKKPDAQMHLVALILGKD